MAPTRDAQIGRFQDIIDTFVELTRHAHVVTLRFVNAAIHYPVSVVAVDRQKRTCLLDITSLGDIAGALAGGQPFILYAQAESAELRSSAMHNASAVSRADRLGLRCPLPEQLTLRRRRSAFRAALATGMTVEVFLQAADGKCCKAKLCDLSVGGCLLSLPAGQVQDLSAGRARYRLSARFPNGQRLEAASRIRRLRRDAEEELVYLGVAFDIGLAEEERAVWFYVNEIEREAARQTNPRLRRQLAPSRLFAAEDDAPAAAPEPLIMGESEKAKHGKA